MNKTLTLIMSFALNSMLSIFPSKSFENLTKKRIFAATNPTTPLNDAYHGGTSLFITPCMDLRSSLLKLFAEYPNVDLHAMGFPKGWENEPLWIV